MIITTYRRMRNAARRITKPARLAIVAWQERQADDEIARMQEARVAAIQHEHRQHLRKVQLSIHRNHIEKGLA